MSKNKTRVRQNITYMAIIGVCLGWMVGMSVSPIIGTVVGALLALVISVASVLVGLPLENELKPGQEKKRRAWLERIQGRISLLPVMVLVIGIVAGEVLGILTRTHDLFSPVKETNLAATPQEGLPPVNLDSIMGIYSAYGLDSAEVGRLVLEFQLGNSYPSANGKSKPFQKAASSHRSQHVDDGHAREALNHGSDATSTSLFSGIHSFDCGELCGKDVVSIRSRLKTLALKSEKSGYSEKPGYSERPGYREIAKLKESELRKRLSKDCGC